MTDEKKVPGGLSRVTMAVDLCGYGPGKGGEANTPTEGAPHNVATSILTNGWHAPALDIDVPMTVVESSTPGHSHLYFDVPMAWHKYVRLMRVLAEVGILEHGYVEASVDRGFSALRLPWVKKAEKKAEEFPWE